MPDTVGSPVALESTPESGFLREVPGEDGALPADWRLSSPRLLGKLIFFSLQLPEAELLTREGNLTVGLLLLVFDLKLWLLSCTAGLRANTGVAQKCSRGIRIWKK